MLNKITILFIDKWMFFKSLKKIMFNEALNENVMKDNARTETSKDKTN